MWCLLCGHWSFYWTRDSIPFFTGILGLSRVPFLWPPSYQLAYEVVHLPRSPRAQISLIAILGYLLGDSTYHNDRYSTKELLF